VPVPDNTIANCAVALIGRERSEERIDPAVRVVACERIVQAEGTAIDSEELPSRQDIDVPGSSGCRSCAAATFRAVTRGADRAGHVCRPSRATWQPRRESSQSAGDGAEHSLQRGHTTGGCGKADDRPPPPANRTMMDPLCHHLAGHPSAFHGAESKARPLLRHLGAGHLRSWTSCTGPRHVRWKTARFRSGPPLARGWHRRCSCSG
jgi:hypothetical protein